MIRRTSGKSLWAFLTALLIAAAAAQAIPRDREPNSVFAERRAKLRAQVNGPVVLFGYTGRENSSPSYIFAQEDNFYYLTGHNEEGAALVLVPEPPAGQTLDGPREILFLPARNLQLERWNGPRIGPDDPGIKDKTGFANVMPFASLREELQLLGKTFTNFHTLLPAQNAAGYPHAANWNAWLKDALPQATLTSVMPLVGPMRQIKSPGELALLTRAIDLSVEAHLEAMRMMRPGLYEYEVASRMEFIHKRGGCETEGYAPIVGAGFNSTLLHYNGVRAKISSGDIVVLDVGGQYGGYSADVTRTLPANGKFTPRQREVYEVVLGAQNAVLAALKPGMMMGGQSDKSLQKIAMDYINSHGKDLQGNPLGRYYIHGLGHHIGLNVHDAGPPRALEPGMVVTIEPGIYIPDERLGVRIEDDVLITETGYKLLTAKAPRTIEEIEKILAEPRKP